MFMTKEEAIDVLENFINTGVIKEDLEDGLESIRMLLKYEVEDKLNLWGADDEAGELFVAVRSDLKTPEYEKRMNGLWEKYSIKD